MVQAAPRVTRPPAAQRGSRVWALQGAVGKCTRPPRCREAQWYRTPAACRAPPCAARRVHVAGMGRIQTQRTCSHSAHSSRGHTPDVCPARPRFRGFRLRSPEDPVRTESCGGRGGGARGRYTCHPGHLSRPGCCQPAGWALDFLQERFSIRGPGEGFCSGWRAGDRSLLLPQPHRSDN